MNDLTNYGHGHHHGHPHHHDERFPFLPFLAGLAVSPFVYGGFYGRPPYYYGPYPYGPRPFPPYGGRPPFYY